MNTALIRQKLYEYIRFADDEKVKAFYTIIAPETIPTKEWWEDKERLAEVQRRDAAMESGEDEGISWPEAKKQLLSGTKKKPRVI